MTLVIGAKFKDGVILVADRKVTNSSSSKEEWAEKLKEPYPSSPINFGATGYKNKYDKFNRKIIEIAAEHMRETDLNNIAFFKQKNLEYPKIEKEAKEDKTLDTVEIEKKTDEQIPSKEPIPLLYNYTMEDFLEDSQNLTRELCTGKDGIIRPQLETLVILLNNGKARLHHLDYDGEEEELDYYAIGSGANYVNLFLERFWNNDMNIEQVLKLAYFCIYYVQDLKFDKNVGVEEGVLPNNRVVLDDGRSGIFNGFDGKEAEIINEVRDQVDKFKDVIANLPF